MIHYEKVSGVRSIVAGVNKPNTLTRNITGVNYLAWKKKEEFYTLCSRLFSIRNPNQDAVIRAVAAATVARETWWQDAEGWRVEGVLCEDMGTMLRLICYHWRNTGRLVEIWHLKRNETDRRGGGRPAALRGADADGVWRISLRV